MKQTETRPPEPGTPPVGTPILRFEKVRKTFPQGKRTVVALDDLDFQVERGEFVSLMGPSGSGKSTLLHLAGGMDLPTSGMVQVAGEDTTKMSDHRLTLLRRRKIGFVFQFFNLMPALSLEENVALPLLLEGVPLSAVRSKARELLERVGLGSRVEHTPEELSGGEMQRAAIARALVTDPPILLADEPTGNLDTANGREILGILRALHEESPERTLMMVTHDPSAAAIADRQVTLRDGKVAS